LLDRAFGKPKEHDPHEAEAEPMAVDLSKLTTEQLNALHNIFRSLAGPAPDMTANKLDD
jgi:hypothetical protein